MTTPQPPRALVEMLWRPTPGYEGLYEVSGNGDLRKLDGTVISQWKCGQGYQRARLSGPRAVVRVHRLVAEAFHGAPPAGAVVNHLNSDRSDNRFDNLEWCTQAENLRHMDAQNRRARYWKGKRSPTAKLSDETVARIRECVPGTSYSMLASTYGVSKRTIGRIVSGQYYPLPAAPAPETPDA